MWWEFMEGLFHLLLFSQWNKQCHKLRVRMGRRYWEGESLKSFYENWRANWLDK